MPYIAISSSGVPENTVQSTLQRFDISAPVAAPITNKPHKALIERFSANSSVLPHIRYEILDEILGCDVEALVLSERRDNWIVDIRRALAALMLEAGWSKTTIGRVLRRDRTTITHHIQIHNAWYNSDEKYTQLYKILRKLQ